jgi:adenine-specific DNA-methyltransferase
METSLKDGDLVLDFFAGSGTTGHAALRLSEEERIDASFILVQLPEPTGRDDYKSISDITKERVRRVIQTHEKQSEGKLDLQQKGQSRRKGGFRVFRLAPSNFKVWDAHTDEGVEGVERQMELAVNHIMPDRTAEDLFYEILMKSEYPLTAKVERFDAAGIAAYSVENDALIICVERKVTAEAVAAIAKRSPSKVIFLDEAFSGNDQLKANAKMNFESAGVKRFETV